MSLGADTGDAVRAELLLARVDLYQKYFRERDYDRAFELVSQWWTESAEERRAWNRSGKRMDNGIRITGYVVTRMLIADDRAKLYVRVAGRTREGVFRWEEFTEDQTEFWTFERENWYYIPFQVSNWDESKAREVPIPAVPAGPEGKEKTP